MRSLPLIRFASYVIVMIIIVGFYPKRHFIEYEFMRGNEWGWWWQMPEPLPLDRESARENYRAKSGIRYGYDAVKIARVDALKMGADETVLRPAAEYFQQFGDSGWYVVTFTVAWEFEGETIVGFFVDETGTCIPIRK